MSNYAIDTEHFEDAIAELRALIVNRPGNAQAHQNLAMFLLSHGRFEEGWKEYRWRLELPEMKYKAHPSLFSVPVWNGERPTGKRVLVWLDQGLGDQILQATMVPDLIADAAHVTVCTHRRAKPLLMKALPGATVVCPTDPIDWTGFDCQMAVHDLGAMYRRSFADFPKSQAFLSVEPLPRYSPHLTVGVSWRSGNFANGDKKSIPLEQFKTLFSVPGITFVNLQYGDDGSDLPANVITDKSVDALYDLERFAAQVAACDFVISASNTTVHVAGALGIPTFALIPKGHGRYWYWFAGRQDSPWYPSVQIFRQQEPGEWGSLIDIVTEFLGFKAAEHTTVVETKESAARRYPTELERATARIAELEAAIEPLLPWSRCDDISVDAIFHGAKDGIPGLKKALVEVLRQTIYVDVNEFKALGKVMRNRWTDGPGHI